MQENFKNLSFGLNEAIKDLGIPKAEVLNRIFNKWESIVGEKIDHFCQPAYFKEGILYLKCNDYTWYSQFKFYKKPIETSIQNELKLLKPIEVQILKVTYN